MSVRVVGPLRLQSLHTASMISATRWVPRGAAAETPRKADLDESEMARIAELAKMELEDAHTDLAEAKGSQANPPSQAKAGSDDDDELAEYNMSDYDNDVAEEEQNTIAGVQGLAYYGADEEDEYLTKPSADDEDEEEGELRIYDTDNMLLAAKTEDDVSMLEVHVYDDKEGSLYVHHDMMLPSFPLCLEWVPIVPGSDAQRGNFVAIGTFEPEIELWDLDLVDAVFPHAILGKVGGNATPVSRGTGKKKRKMKKANDEYHVDAVLSLSSNPNHVNLLASGSADMTVKLWDLGSDGSFEKAARSLSNYHKNKVSSVAWNPTEATALLSGGYDGYARVGDMRSSNVVKDSRSFKVSTGDIESVQWDKDGVHFFAGTDGGQIYKFDARAADKPVWTLQAHDTEVTSFSTNPYIDNCLVTASTDKTVKLWNLAHDKPSMVLSRDLDVGKVFSVAFSPDNETRSLISVAGSDGKLKVWDLFSNRTVRQAFLSKDALVNHKEERIIIANDDDEESDDADDGAEGGDFGDAEEFDEEEA